jgi:hypothetical protein
MEERIMAFGLREKYLSSRGPSSGEVTQTVRHMASTRRSKKKLKNALNRNFIRCGKDLRFKKLFIEKAVKTLALSQTITEDFKVRA